MPLRITTRRVTGPFFGAEVCVVQEQRYERVLDPNFPVKPAISAAGADDDTMLSAIDYRPNTPAADFAFLLRQLGMAVNNGEVFRSNGDNPFLALVKPIADFGPSVQGGPWPEMKRIISTYETWMYAHWHETGWNETVQNWVAAMQSESPRTMLTIQEYIDRVDRWGAATANVVLSSFPDRSTPLWQITDSGPTVALPPLERISHEIQRVTASGSQSLTQEAQRWQMIADAFPGTPEGDRAAEVAAYLRAQPLGASTTAYTTWVAAALKASFELMPPIEPLSAVAARPADPSAASRFAKELDRIVAGPDTRPVENTRWRQIANDVGPDTTAGLVALDVAGWISAAYDETDPARVAEYQGWAGRMLTRSLSGVTPPP